MEEQTGKFSSPNCIIISYQDKYEKIQNYNHFHVGSVYSGRRGNR